MFLFKSISQLNPANTLPFPKCAALKSDLVVDIQDDTSVRFEFFTRCDTTNISIKFYKTNFFGFIFKEKLIPKKR